MNIDSAVVCRYISPLYDHPRVCDWAKIVAKIGRKFAAFCRSHCSGNESGKMRVSPPPPPTKIKFRLKKVSGPTMNYDRVGKVNFLRDFTALIQQLDRQPSHDEIGRVLRGSN